jgi:hypothetical protein
MRRSNTSKIVYRCITFMLPSIRRFVMSLPLYGATVQNSSTIISKDIAVILIALADLRRYIRFSRTNSTES